MFALHFLVVLTGPDFGLDNVRPGATLGAVLGFVFGFWFSDRWSWFW
jgi:hypothetical protein